MLKYFETDEYRQLFRDKFCKTQTPEDCQIRYQRMIDVRLETRYFGADRAAVSRTCDANPGRCDDPIAYEMLMLDSHNDHVRRDAARAELAIQRRRARRAADIDRSLGAILGVVGYGGTNQVCSNGRR